MIWVYAPKALLQVVWSRPRVARRDGHIWRWRHFWQVGLRWQVVDDCEGQSRGGITASAEEVSENTRRGRQRVEVRAAFCCPLLYK